MTLQLMHERTDPILVNPLPNEETMEKLEGGGGADFGIYHQSGRRYTKMTITLSAVCLIVGGLVRGVWDVAEYSHQQQELNARITSLETATQAQQTKLDTARDQITANIRKQQETDARITSMEANERVQQSALDTAREMLNTNTDRTVDMRSQMTSLETALGQANQML